MSGVLVAKAQVVERGGMKMTIAPNAIAVEVDGKTETVFFGSGGTAVEEKKAPKPEKQETKEYRKIVKEQPVKKG